MCHSCTNLVHDIVPEVYYLHEVCHSCTNLVHDIVPEVYYLHEVCHSCTNLVHVIVLKEQWIWPICNILFHKLTRKVSKRSSAVWETNPACERTVSFARTLAFIEHGHCFHHRWFTCVYIVGSFVWQRLSHYAPR